MVAVAAKAVLSADTSKGAAVVAVISAVRLNALIVAVCASLGSPIIAANSNSVSQLRFQDQSSIRYQVFQQ